MHPTEKHTLRYKTMPFREQAEQSFPPKLVHPSPHDKENPESRQLSSNVMTSDLCVCVCVVSEKLITGNHRNWARAPEEEEQFLKKPERNGSSSISFRIEISLIECDRNWKSSATASKSNFRAQKIVKITPPPLLLWTYADTQIKYMFDLDELASAKSTKPSRSIRRESKKRNCNVLTGAHLVYFPAFDELPREDLGNTWWGIPTMLLTNRARVA